jgi:hypothetical protein
VLRITKIYFVCSVNNLIFLIQRLKCLSGEDEVLRLIEKYCELADVVICFPQSSIQEVRIPEIKKTVRHKIKEMERSPGYKFPKFLNIIASQHPSSKHLQYKLQNFPDGRTEGPNFYSSYIINMYTSTLRS